MQELITLPVYQFLTKILFLQIVFTSLSLNDLNSSTYFHASPNYHFPQ